MTHAFVKPGRSHDFVCHVGCATSTLVKAMVSVYGSMERVPVTKGMGAEACIWACREMCARLERMKN